MKWIELTDLEGRPIWVNMEAMQTMRRYPEAEMAAAPSDGAHTSLRGRNGEAVAVSETPNQILARIWP